MGEHGSMIHGRREGLLYLGLEGRDSNETLPNACIHVFVNQQKCRKRQRYLMKLGKGGPKHSSSHNTFYENLGIK